jgi:hypothetical protein
MDRLIRHWMVFTKLALACLSTNPPMLASIAPNITYDIIFCVMISYNYPVYPTGLSYDFVYDILVICNNILYVIQYHTVTSISCIASYNNNKNIT